MEIDGAGVEIGRVGQWRCSRRRCARARHPQTILQHCNISIIPIHLLLLSFNAQLIPSLSGIDYANLDATCNDQFNSIQFNSLLMLEFAK